MSKTQHYLSANNVSQLIITTVMLVAKETNMTELETDFRL